MAGKFQIRSRRWDIGVLVASLVVLVLGIGGLFLLQASGNSAGGPTNLFVAVLGVITFLLFAGPGLVYVARKRIKKLKDALPGGTMTWIRSHLYLPIVALLAAYAHAQAVPFRAHLTSGKVLIVLGILVSIGGMARHHLIGIQKAALNVNVAIGKLTTGQPRAFRRLVADYTDHKRSREEVDAAMAAFEPALQDKWRAITEISDEVEKHFPRGGGQSWHIRQYKLWRALHPPLTVALFLVLAFHVWDVFGGTRSLAGETHQFAAASECAGCHGDVFEEWAGSTMSHAATSTVNEAQLPITLAENARIIDEFDGEAPLALLTGRDLEADSQQELVEDNAHVCIDCHTPAGGSFTDDPFELLPFGQDGSPVSGNDAVTSDGIGCIVCHTQEVPPAELAGGGEREGENSLVANAHVSGGGFGTMYGPIFEDPNPVPVRIHGIETPSGDDDDEGFWRNDVETSQLCGACHNVKLDIDGDGLTDVDDAEEQGILEIIDDPEDEDGDFILDENELDDDRVQTEDGAPADDQDDGGDGLIDDLVLQTTYDEWQDYVAFFDVDGGFTDRYADTDVPNELDGPLGCNGCHMPRATDGDERPVIDYAPGVLSRPDRDYRSHSFVGVDYDLDPDLYRESGLSDDDIARVVAERDALVQSAVTLQVTELDSDDPAFLPVEVQVRNNLLAHSFPTGFAFARQFWLEVSAVDGDGDPVCLVPAFDIDGEAAVNTPCGSGFADPEGTEPVEGDAELRQCDTRALAQALGVDPDDAREAGGAIEGTNIVLPNLDIDFAGDRRTDFSGAFGPDDCDPWLANFQKILTDGDPDGDGVRQEVPYQPLLPDAVKVRGQVVSGLKLDALQPVRLVDVDGDGVPDPASSVAVPYVFAVPDGVDPADVVVTARMRFRHLPPYFVRDLEARQEALIEAEGDDAVPPGARIDADELLAHMVVADVVTATTEDDGEQLECPGPQNDEDTILDCVSERDVDAVREKLDLGSGRGDRGDGGGFRRDSGEEEGSGLLPTGGALALWGPLGMALVVPIAGFRRRLRRLQQRVRA